ncbi:GAF domain-containing sensor histidine kinase [Daejeonella lutea]|uniref:histidine kinase n=1 Tax=Daejeonella lutea TaxID=572036 RepID=A0A1T5F099_9SPHI|nr:GAF domain-containing sensor histidine kinase [Daejeonella lutea]SKB89634.1 GAF domain-containing protein [Daejeonella lutea]
MTTQFPTPANELDRILTLSDFNVDYSNFDDQFKDLAKLAASVAGTEISLVGLIDSYTQWIISGHGMEIQQTPREETVCQYTIMEEDHLEIENLSMDSRFQEKPFVTKDPNLRYYYGIPLKSEGHNIGTLCLLDRSAKKLAPEKTELLKIIAEEIVNRLKTYKTIELLRHKVTEVTDTKNKVVHDIRGPLGGIIGLAQIISEQGKDNNMDEVLEFINLIHKSGNSILELADEILSAEKKTTVKVKGDELNLRVFREKLEKLYVPQAKIKGIKFTVSISPETETVPFPKNKLLQITGNLISNAIKFTPQGGNVQVNLVLTARENPNVLRISVTDSGSGLTQSQIDNIIEGTSTSTEGTDGEAGYGFGLALVKHLIDGLRGSFNITSDQAGATFEVILPQ